MKNGQLKKRSQQGIEQKYSLTAKKSNVFLPPTHFGDLGHHFNQNNGFVLRSVGSCPLQKALLARPNRFILLSGRRSGKGSTAPIARLDFLTKRYKLCLQLATASRTLS
jgi:hypothetical protein